MTQRFAVNAHVWFPSKSHVWEEASVKAQSDDQVVIEPVLGSQPISIHVSKCYPKEDDRGSVDDMTKLSHLHEPGVLHNLHQRYLCNQIYTYTGGILIAVNPFTTVRGLYDDEMKIQYRGAHLGELAPHVFAVADNAYRAMIRGKRCQSILISGESGAGKTETTKLVMEYVAELSGRPMEDEKSVEARILESNPILEAFGNAKTSRNHNSSRFGKFVQILFDSNGKVCGAVIKAYLLEKSRVVQIRDPERTYHCFYQLCHGATPEEAKRYMLPEGLDRAQKFNYLSQSNCFELSARETDAQNFLYTKQAMTLMGITEQEQEALFKMLSAILHLGNVVFFETETEQGLQVPESAKRELDIIASLLQCERGELEDSLTTINRRMGANWVKSPLSSKTAASKRDSLAKNLYAKIFSWIVGKINDAISGKGEISSYIAVLDIYGFEHFASNSFEQFCINLANEKLQQHFNQTVLKLEQEEYIKEEINWTRIEFDDNQDILDLIEQSQGIISLLDDACKFEGSSATRFTEKIHSTWGSHKRLSKVFSSSLTFTLQHYAGEVVYSTEEFIAKNSDSFTPEHERLLKMSKDDFISSLFPKLEEIGSRNKFVSLGNAFKVQLKELMHTLFETEPHYIRCVKPNLQLKPSLFDRQLVIQQLRSGGVLEAVRVCSTGYPARQKFSDFIERFDILNTKTLGESMTEKERCISILSETPLSDYQVGKTKVFFREGQMVQLETLRLEILNIAATKIQRFFRRHYYGVRRLAAVILQSWWRGQLGVRNCQQSQKSNAILVIQTFQRMKIQQRHFQKCLSSVIFCQRNWRAQIVRRKKRNEIYAKAATIIQRAWRKYVKRRPWIHLHKLARGQLASKELLLLREKVSVLSAKVQKSPSTEVKVELLQVKCDELSGQLGHSTEDAKSLRAEILNLKKENKCLQNLVDSKTEEINHLHLSLMKLQSESTVKGDPEKTQLPTIREEDERSVTSKDSVSLSLLSMKVRRGIPIGNEMLVNFLYRMEKEAEAAQQLKKHNLLLQAYNKALQVETEESERQLEKMVEDLSFKDKQISSLHAQLRNLKERQKEIEAGRTRLETEAKVLGNRLLDLHPSNNFRSLESDQEELLKEVTESNLGFTDDGFPIATNLLYKAIVSGKIELESEEALFLSRIAKHIQHMAEKDEEEVANWLTVAVCLYYLLQTFAPHKAKKVLRISIFGRKEAATKKSIEPPGLLTFKCKLRAGIEKLYISFVTARKNVLNEVLQNVAESQGDGKGLQRSATQQRRTVVEYWGNILLILRESLDQLCIRRVPVYLLSSIMRHLISFISCRVFNCMMVRKAWCPLTFGNGEALSAQVEGLKKWLSYIDIRLKDELPSHQPLSLQLEPLQQLVNFLLLDHKAKRSVEEIQEVCRSFNVRQLLCVCQYYADDEYGTKGVDSRVVDYLRGMDDDSALLLQENQTLTLSLDDVMESMKGDPIGEPTP